MNTEQKMVKGQNTFTVCVNQLDMFDYSSKSFQAMFKRLMKDE